MKELKYAISSYQASTFSVTCFPYIIARSEFERAKGKIPFLQSIERQFNLYLLRMGGSALNKKLVGPHVFDSMELHLTDPRWFYNPFEWNINERMIQLVKGPISSFHAHVEINPLLHRYAFNTADDSPRTRRAIRSQLETAYRIMHAHSEMILSDNPVFVFHGGVAKNEADREKALERTRANLEYLAAANHELYIKYPFVTIYFHFLLFFFLIKNFL